MTTETIQNNDGIDLKLTLKTGLSSAVTGEVKAFAGNVIPEGYLKCDGALVSRADYADLFDVIGTTYGAGDGTTTFNVPDLRGEFIRGLDDGRGVDNGRALGSAQADEFKEHDVFFTGNVAGDGSKHALPFGSLMMESSLDAPFSVADVKTGTAAGGSETRPRNVAMHYIIKV